MTNSLFMFYISFLEQNILYLQKILYLLFFKIYRRPQMSHLTL